MDLVVVVIASKVETQMQVVTGPIVVSVVVDILVKVEVVEQIAVP